MKERNRYIWVVIYLLLSIAISGQTQQGMVKTRGRMIDGKLKPGIGLKEATIQIKERHLLSEADGKFSFNLTTKKYQLVSVIKKGYELVDRDACRYYDYSSNPLYVIMETPDQLLQDQLDAEEKIRTQLTRQLNQKKAEIRKLNISVAEQNKMIQQLNRKQSENEHLIEDMANRYAMLDYDQMDDFYKDVSACIENGELTKADSILRSRGDVNMQVEQQLNEGKKLDSIKNQVRKAEEVHKYNNDELIQRCQKFFDSYKMQYQKDSANHYLSQCIRLDSTNVELINEAGNYAREYLADYAKANYYYNKGLDLAKKQEETPGYLVATCYNNLGNIHYDKGEYDLALDCYKKAIEIKESYLGQDNLGIATYLNNMGNVYTAKHDYTHALVFHQRALDIREKELGSQHPDVAGSYNNIGAIYRDQKDYSKALNYYMKALSIRESKLGLKNIHTATTYNNIGLTYSYIEDYDSALFYHQKALSIREEVLGLEHPHTAFSYNNIGSTFYQKGEFDKALDYQLKALTIRESVFGKDHPSTATSYNNVASLYKLIGDYEKSVEYFEKALSSYRAIGGEDSRNVTRTIQNIDSVRRNLEDKSAK